ncbi:hypothetical protein SAMN05518670_3361 [Paenibacillus sp. OK076]|nr:hypothetical protein SAMN05518670_3361 [Paenibacillus sp. OK076]
MSACIVPCYLAFMKMIAGASGTMALGWIYSVVKVKPSMRQFSTVCLQLPGFILPSQRFEVLRFS